MTPRAWLPEQNGGASQTRDPIFVDDDAIRRFAPFFLGEFLWRVGGSSQELNLVAASATAGPTALEVVLLGLMV